MRRYRLAVFLVSIALIGFEVCLLQVLSFVQWHHFVAMIVSIALIGFGASGSAISLAQTWMLARFDRVVTWALALCAMTMATAVAVTQWPGVRFDSYLIFVDRAHLGAFALTCLVLLVPFFFGALAIGLTFARFTDDVGRLYFWNLLGSGFGAFLPIPLMWSTEPAALAPFLALFAAAGGAASAAAAQRKYLRLVVAIAFGVSLALLLSPPRLTPSQFKDIRLALDLPDSRVLRERVSPLGLVQVVSTPVSRSAPGLSLRFTGQLPVRNQAFVNGDAAGAIGEWSSFDSTSVLDYTTRFLPYEIVTVAETVLVLGAATGEAVSHALSHGGKQISAIEPNIALSQLVRDTPSSSLNQRRVEVHNVEPRAFVESEDRLFDLIVLPDVGQFGGSIGLESTREDFLMTRQALGEMFARLTPDGAITITTWMDYPYRHALKTVALLADLARRSGLEPKSHIAAVRSWTDVTFVLANAPLSVESSERIRTRCRELAFDPLLLPNIRSDERMYMNELEDTSLFASIDALTGSDWADFVGDFAFVIDPPTDDRPYYHRFLRWGSLATLSRQFGSQTTPFFGLGLFIGVLTLLVTAGLSILLILLPLVRLRTTTTGLLRTLAYFGAIGAGYMFIEIVLIQRFTMVLGHPVYSVALVLGVLLVSSGMGALLSSTASPRGAYVVRSVLIITLASLAYAVTLPSLVSLVVTQPHVTRLTISVLLVAPLGVALGYPFPLGLRLLSNRAQSQVPWAWGVNGFLSVVGASAAPLISMEWGFTSLLVLAGTMYALAGLAVLGRTAD